MTLHNECTIHNSPIYNCGLCDVCGLVGKCSMWEINTISPNCIISIPFLIDMNEVLSFETWHEHERTMLKGLILHLTWNLLITFVDYFNRRPSIVQYDTEYPNRIGIHSWHFLGSFFLYLRVCHVFGLSIWHKTFNCNSFDKWKNISSLCRCYKLLKNSLLRISALDLSVYGMFCIGLLIYTYRKKNSFVGNKDWPEVLRLNAFTTCISRVWHFHNVMNDKRKRKIASSKRKICTQKALAFNLTRKST